MEPYFGAVVLAVLLVHWSSCRAALLQPRALVDDRSGALDGASYCSMNFTFDVFVRSGLVNVNVTIWFPEADQPLTFYVPPSTVGTYFLVDYGAFVSDVTFSPADSPQESIPLSRRHFNHTTTFTVPPNITVRPVRGVLSYLVNLTEQETHLESIGQLVAASHVYHHHSLISMYGVTVLPVGLETNCTASRAVQLHDVGLPESHSPVSWESVIAGCIHSNPSTGLSLFDIMDSPVAVVVPLYLKVFRIADGLQKLVLLCDSSPSATFEQQLQLAVTHAALALNESKLLNWQTVDCPYHVVWELVHPSGSTGWALEHSQAFQAMDNDTAQYPQIEVDYQAIHHETHSHFIPRVLYTDLLLPLRQVRGERSQFIFFAEGFAQHIAFELLGKAGIHSTESLVLAWVMRFGTSVLQSQSAVQARNVTLLEINTEMYDNQTLWFYNFAVGAYLALAIDFANNATLLPELRAIKDAFPLGIPEASFETTVEGATHLIGIQTLFRKYVRTAGAIPDVVQMSLEYLGVVIENPGNWQDPQLRYLDDDEVSAQTAAFRSAAFSAA